MELDTAQGQQLCCETCFTTKKYLLKQALYVMLIKLKAATMDRSQPISDAEMDWRYRDPELDFRYRIWRTQWAKEASRLTRSCGYEANDEEVVANVDEDEFDAGWYFPLPQAEIRAQLSDLNGRSDRGIQYPEEDFWLDRPDSNQMAETRSEGNSTQRVVDNMDMHEEDSNDDNMDLHEEDFDEDDDNVDMYEEDFDDEGSESSSGWGDDNCVCGGDPCVCMEA